MMLAVDKVNLLYICRLANGEPTFYKGHICTVQVTRVKSLEFKLPTPLINTTPALHDILYSAFLQRKRGYLFL